jgi:hypothetical protein
MFSENQLVSQWRQLPSNQQQEVIDFVAFLAQRRHAQQPPQTVTAKPSRSQFQQLREQIITAGIPLLNDTEIEQEVSDRRGGYQESAS